MNFQKVADWINRHTGPLSKLSVAQVEGVVNAIAQDVRIAQEIVALIADRHGPDVFPGAAGAEPRPRQ